MSDLTVGKTTLTLTTIDCRETWMRWSEAWDELVEHRPMRSTAWLVQWWEQFQSPAKNLRIWLIRHDEHLVGIAPLYEMRVGGKSVLRLLGDSGDICTDHTTWFARPEYAQSVGEAVAEQLLKTADWHRLHFEAIDEADAAMSAMMKKLETGGCLIHATPQANCWSVELPTTWEDYLSSLSKNHRKRCRRWVKNYFDNGRVQIHTATSEDNGQDSWRECWRVFLDLHRQRWGDEKREDGCFSNPRFSAFHEQVSRRLAAKQQLRLCYLALDGEPIASEYQLLDQTTLYSYQSGMSEQHRDIGPGNLSLLATVRYCLDHGIQHLDLMRGDEPYKSHWLAEPTPRADVRVWRPGLPGQVEYSFQKARRLAAAWLRR